MLNKKPMSDERREYLRGVEAAMGRASKVARATARQFNTPIVTERNGQIVNVFLNEKVETGKLSAGKIEIRTSDISYWQDAEGYFVGFLNDYPEHERQGLTKEELLANLEDLMTEIEAGQVRYVRCVEELGVA
jgi:predicted RNase H-like HicB family nuclease